jgi:predicted ferric reductase
MRRSILWGVAAGALVLLIADAVAARCGLVVLALPHARGTSAWTFSRAAGVAAYVALTLDVLFGLLLSTGAADRWIKRARSAEVHRFLAVGALALTLGHAAALLFDGWARLDVLDLLVPFAASYRRAAVGAGVLAAWVALAVHASFALRRRIGQRAWRALHYLSFAAFAMAAAHGLRAGTDHAQPWLHGIYVGSAGLVVWLTLFRVVMAVLPGRSRAGRASELLPIRTS